MWSFEPCKVVGLKNIVQVASGEIHSTALVKEGKVFTWRCESDGS